MKYKEYDTSFVEKWIVGRIMLFTEEYQCNQRNEQKNTAK